MYQIGSDRLWSWHCELLKANQCQHHFVFRTQLLTNFIRKSKEKKQKRIHSFATDFAEMSEKQPATIYFIEATPKSFFYSLNESWKSFLFEERKKSSNEMENFEFLTQTPAQKKRIRKWDSILWKLLIW